MARRPSKTAPDVGQIAVPEPPWRTPSRPRAPRPVLNRDVIVDAALRALDRDGAEGLTMRAVADDLGVGAASLYTHVANKEELIQLVIDRVMGGVEAPEVDVDNWQEGLKAFMRAVRAASQAHPGVAGLTLGRVPMGVNMLEKMETLLDVGRRAGLPDRISAFAGDLLGLYVGAFGYEEDMAARAGTPDGGTDMAALMRAWFESLPEEHFPNIVAMAGVMTEGGLDERFEWGMDVIVRGLATFVGEPDPRQTQTARGRRRRS